MSQQFVTKSPRKTRRQLTRPVSGQPGQPNRPLARSSRSGIPSPILQLQRTLGNQRVAQLIRARRLTPQGRIIGLQRKLTVGAADDQYEQEADRVARQVMNMPDAVSATQTAIARAALPQGVPGEKAAEEDEDKTLQTPPPAAAITPLAQRQTLPEEEEAEPIQASPAGSLADSFEAGEDVESRLNRSKGGGSPLPDAVRSFMEPRFGMDFSQVRTHIGSDAIQMNRDVGANAFTHGADIYYGAHSSPDNLELTAHELTHVVQQTGGAPLQRKRMAEAALPHPFPSVQRAGADTSIALSSRTTELPIQRDKIGHRALTWDDFQGDAPKKAKYDAVTASFFEEPDLKALLPANAAIDTTEPCKAKGKDLTRFTVDITIDSSLIQVKSFMDQEKSWHKLWTTDEPARREKCEKDFSSKCEKAFKKQFSKIKKAVAKEKSSCQKDFGKMEKDAKKQCKPAVADCKAAFKNGDPSFTIEFDGTEITANTKKECTKVLLPGCVAASMEGQEVTRTLGSESATATTKAECKTKFAPELEALLKNEITWEATMSGASTTVSKPEDCRTTFLDACATDLMEAGSDSLLKHEQAHFDLTEAMAQKAQSDLRSLVDGFSTEVDACGQKAAEAKAKKTLAGELKKMKKNYAGNEKLRKKKQSQYDKETKHGIVEEKQAAWEEKISKGF
ncbi:DUF4157 domain-containing protein [Nitrosospira sp. NpAV]|uniref:eCIS core domain-containing protein n=1 Tax=Nitrosospira sp. NpAV TaxID=58133 RepID=UPI0006970289|nr:DUF4157 domain-containing protein [Nitrosospira sp. NpAV]